MSFSERIRFLKEKNMTAFLLFGLWLVVENLIFANVVIPRPNPDHYATPWVRMIFLEYVDVDGTSKGISEMSETIF